MRLRFAARALKAAAWDAAGRLLQPLHHLVARRKTRPVPPEPRVLIFGWFGTETTGDRAILLECCRILQEALQRPHFRIASSVPARTRETAELLDLELEVVSPSATGWLDELRSADLVVVAGGPLMDDGEMLAWWVRLLAARWLEKPALLLGLGAHPLNLTGTRRAARACIALAQRAALREEPPEALRCAHLRVFTDPALYGEIPRRRRAPDAGGLRLAANLRPWPIAFFGGPWREYASTWTRFRREFLQAIADLLQAGVVGEVVFFPMHEVPPDDDRSLYPEIAAGLPEDRVTFVTGLPTPREVTGLLAGCDAFVGMRFHANLLAALAGAPGVGVDYDSAGGKISRFYGSLGCADMAVPLAQVTRGELSSRLQDIRHNWSDWHTRVTSGRDRLRAGRAELVEWLR
ncbi:MAG: polysaccharide pyruvyl transferase family protein [Candidatus Eremiobacterota bacterium]